MNEFPFELDDFQKEACKIIDNGNSVVVCAPTGAGKTVIAQHAIHIALKENVRIFYTTPLKALSNQKYNDFGLKYGYDKVGLLTGDTSINRSGQIVVMTTEVFRNMLYGTNLGSVADNLNNVKYVVLDEVHYMNDEDRGTVWEESIIYCPTNIQIIALSATVANCQQLTDWINSVHPKCELVNTDFRPVPLRFYYYDSSQPYKLLPLLTPSGALNNKIKPEPKPWGRNKNKKNQNPVKNVVSNLYEQDMLPAIYFTFSRKKCDEQMEKCAGLELITNEERERIRSIVDEYIAENYYLANNKHIEYLYCGVASHHAGLLPGWKVLVEKLFQEGLIKVVFATETLAAGINMPARSTVISSISKRTDSGHRLLTSSEFLQMSGRAGRRGMDEIGYVTIVGTPHQSPQDVADLVLSDANDLESRFSPRYSMVLNLLQRFTIDDAKSLILKSFGYFSSNARLAPLLLQKEHNQQVIDEMDSFKCSYNLMNKDLIEYNRIKNLYVSNRQTCKTIRKQEKNKKRPFSQDFLEFEKTTKSMLHQMQEFECDKCKFYKKHMKSIELLERYNRKQNKLLKEIELQKDIYWNNFVNHKDVLVEMGYMKDNYPTTQGQIVSQIRAENELYIAEIIFSNILEGLTPAELASVICSVTTEDIRGESHAQLPLSKKVRKTLNLVKDIRRKLDKIQKNHNIDDSMYINTFFAPLIEMWVNGAEWESIVEETEFNEGDIVRVFKRTIDILRQFCTIDNIPDWLVFTAREAIDAIQREPVNVE
ncbi:DEAD/DEAH box helicase [bacterium]|nr:DEAD/DEAH box helicase [bacterium]